MTLAANDHFRLHGLAFDIAGMSEQGPRDENQDALTLEDFGRTGFVAVADGMGGERGGRVAADTALKALSAEAPIVSPDAARRAVRAADSAVTAAAQQSPDEHGGMGCALGLIALTPGGDGGPQWIGAHVGDVRILSRSPDGALRLETRDHTPAFARWEAGEISLDEIPDSPGANRLQRAVGRGGQPDVSWMPARPGWSWLIISDGIYKALRLDELADLMSAGSAAATCDAIRQKVEERGPDDNFTALMVRALPNETEPRTATDPMPAMTTPTHTRPPARSGLAIAALVLSLVAIGLAAFAFLTLQEATENSATRAELDRLEIAVDSLDARVTALDEPFGPSAPSPVDSAAVVSGANVDRE